MDDKSVMDALVQMKRTYTLLNELMDLTQQLGQAIDRNDQVSIGMLIGMREDPLLKLQQADTAIREQLEEIPDRMVSAQLACMLNGGPPAEENSRTQQMLCEQVAVNQRSLKQIRELDERINRRLAGSKSVY